MSSQALLESLKDRLIRGGDDDAVIQALDEAPLGRQEHRALCEAMLECGRDKAVAAGLLELLFTHGVVHPEGLRRGLFAELALPSGKAALSVDYRKAGRSPHLFLYSHAKGPRLTVDELKDVLETLVPPSARGAEIKRAAAEKDKRFWVVPAFPPEVDTKFYENAYVVSVFDFSKAPPSIRVDLPKE